jgi:5,10-methylenetetrahydromethanopterin reductase
MAIRVTVSFQQSGPISEIVRIAQLAESLGFDGLWLNDAQSHWREVYVSLGAIGAATSRIELGPGVTNVSTRHLSVTASAIYSLDELTGGRARMGIGSGAAAVTDIGNKPARRADLSRAVATLRELWAGREAVFDGARFQLEYAVSSPRSIPVYLSSSAPRMSRLAGEIADGMLCNVGVESRAIEAALFNMQEGARAAGRNPNDRRAAARIPACISDDPEAKRYVRARVGVSAMRRAASDFDETDRRTMEKIRQAYDPREHLRLDAAYAARVTDSLIEKFALAGRPEECLERLRAIAKTGVDELNLAFMHPDTETLLRIFAERIMSRI